MTKPLPWELVDGVTRTRMDVLVLGNHVVEKVG